MVAANFAGLALDGVAQYFDAVSRRPADGGGGVQIALVVGAFGAAPLLPAVSRWSVTVDAIATALQMIVTAAALFVWTRVLGQGRR